MSLVLCAPSAEILISLGTARSAQALRPVSSFACCPGIALHVCLNLKQFETSCTVLSVRALSPPTKLIRGVTFLPHIRMLFHTLFRTDDCIIIICP